MDKRFAAAGSAALGRGHAGWLGVVELAAHQVVITISQLFFLMMQGLSFALSILVSNACGRGDYRGVRRPTWLIRKSIDKDAILEKVRASEGKPLPKSKWQQKLEEVQRMQEQQLKQQQKRR